MHRLERYKILMTNVTALLAGRPENSFHSLKQKSVFFLIAISLFVFFMSWGLLRTFYLQAHESYIRSSFIELLRSIDDDFENVDKSIDWTKKTLNVNLHKFEDVEELIVEVPTYINKEKFLSLNERKKINQGDYVVKKFKVTDFGVNLTSFFYPVMKNGVLECLLFIYLPVNNATKESLVFSLVVVIIGMIAALLIFMIAKKSFGKSYNQLQEIKLAATEVSKGNFDAKIWEKSDDELGEISDIINVMSVSLKNNQERMKEFMEDILHEIKTPLTYIKTYNQALMDGMIQEPEEQQKSFRLIDRETNRLQKLIQNFLDFTKLDAEAVELNKQPIVFAQAIEEIMMKYEPIFHRQHIQFEMSLDYDVIIDGDEERLEQIIQNIVQNAIRYSKENPHIEMKLEKQGKKCILSISDNGIGISKEHIDIITNRFVRVNKVRSRKESGTGIGLSIVEKLMTLHGGKMEIESELGVGTTFKLTFPCID